MMLMAALLEVFGIGLVLPILAMMTQIDLIERYPILQPWWEMFGRPSHVEMNVIGMAMLVLAYALKVVFIVFVTWRQSLFVFSLQAALSKKLFAGYLAQPYIFHLQNNSAQIMRNIVTEVNMLTNTVLLPTMLLLTEGMAIVAIAMLLLSVEPLAAMCMLAVFGGVGFLFQYAFRVPLQRWGKARQHHQGKLIQHVQQGFGGVKEIKLLGREAEQLAQFEVHNLGSARVVHRQNVLRQMPRLWFELLAISGMAVLVVVMLLKGSSPTSLLSTLGLFSVAGFRLMISSNRVLGAIQSGRYGNSIINTLDEAFRLFESSAKSSASVATLPFKDAIELRKVSHRYPGTLRNSLNDIDVRIPCRSTVGFIGASGAGKTTLVDLVLGLLEPSVGSVCVDGVDIHDNLRGWQSQIGYVPQSIYLADATLRRNIAYCIPNAIISDDAVWSAVRSAQLEDLVSQLPQGLDTLVGEQGVRLSGGQRQRIGIARALYHDPAVLVLDEATSALDSETESEVINSIAALRGEKTVLIISHRLSAIEHCDWVYRLEAGGIASRGLVRE
jgi:ABC-type multidrug transport system fused ATPase/permease subunit